MVIVGREVLKRLPMLRSTWPVQQASAWRQQQRWRAHPRRMASWYCDSADMHTRVFVSNLAVPEAPQLSRTISINARLLDEQGAQLTAQRFSIASEASLVLELQDLLPASKRGHAPSGQVLIDFEGPQLGSSRAYLHWYNAHSLTSSHEKFGLSIPAVGGYWSVPNVQDHEEYRVHLAVANLDERPYTSELTLKDDEGHALRAELELPPNGSRFVRLDALFHDIAGFLHGQPGVLYFGNNAQPAMYYYFIHNERRGAWRAQHL